MAIRVYGYRPGGATLNWFGVFAGWEHSLIGQEFNEQLTYAGRIIAMGSWTGRVAGVASAQKKWAAYLTNTFSSSGSYPYLGETNAATVTAAYVSNTGGSDVNANVNAGTVLLSRKSRSGHILAYAGDEFMISGLELNSGSYKKTAVGRSLGSVAAASGSRLIQALWGTNVFPDPSASNWSNAIVSIGDKFAIYALVEENRAPSFSFTVLGNPISEQPAGSPTIFSTVTPTLYVRFTDQDRLATPSYYDYPKEIVLSVYRWTGTTWTNEGETSYQAGVHYAIPADAQDEPVFELAAPAGLDVDEVYRVHVRGRDELDVWSTSYSNSASSWASQLEFTIVEGGYVESVTPTGRITDLTPDFTATYENASGLSSATMQVRLLTRSGSGFYVVAQTSPVEAEVVAPGGTLSFPWSDTDFVSLVSSMDYAVEWRIVDSSGVVGPWIGRTSFHTNYRPDTPASLSPAGNNQTSTAPRLTFNAADRDDTPASAGGNLTARVEITGPYLVNGGLETDDSGWTAGLTHANTTVTRGRATDQFRTGLASYKLNVTANTAAPGFADSQSVLHPVVEGYTYTVSAYRRITSANVPAQIGFYWYNASSVFLSGSFGAAGSDNLNTWQPIGASAVSPAGATQMRIVMRAAPLLSGNTGTVWFDDIVPSSGARAVLAATKDTTGSQWYVQTNLTNEVAAAGQYSWRAQSTDTDLFSLWSSSATFIMAVGPEVDVTYPASLESLSTHRPVITWTVTGDQNRFQVIIRDSTTNAVRLSTGWIAEPATRSYLVPTAILRNIDDVNVQVVSENSGGQSGFSSNVRFLVSYPPPAAPENLAVSYEYLYADDDPSAVRLTWTPVDTAPDLLVGMEIWRMDNSDPSSMRLIATFAGFDPGTYLDRTMKSGIPCRYFVRQETLQAGVEAYGDQAEIDALISINAAILEVVGAEETERVVMRFWSSRSLTLTQQQAFVIPAGGGDYVEQLGFGTGRDFSVNWQVIDASAYNGASGLTARQHIENLVRVFDDQSIYTYRDGTGNHEYVRINGNPSINYRNSGGYLAEVSLSLRRIAYTAPEIVDEN